jgi:hypothetical protein
VTASSLPLADAGSLRLLARRTHVLRLALAGALAATAVSAILLARGPHASAGAFVPAGSNTIVVLDVSQSVEFNKLQLAYGTLTFLGHSKAKVGLVVCSSYAYEALPPGSPASALLPIAKLFRPIGVRLAYRGGLPRFVLPPNPWVAGFSAGTELASGLALARTIITDEHLRRPSVVLISDLFDDSNDLARVSEEGKTYQRLGIGLRIAPLAPTEADLQFFRRAAGQQETLLQPKAPKQANAQLLTRFPTSLVAFAAVLALLLALDEVLLSPLRWGAATITWKWLA